MSEKTQSNTSDPFDKIEFLHRHQKYSENAIVYKVSELSKLVAAAKEAFKADQMLLEVPSPVKVVGDVHGQYKDLHSYFATLGRPDTTRYLFLGDYVDRGPKQLETIACLMAWKINYPKQFYMLRGNHETRSINRAYGFMTELTSRFGANEGSDLWEEFNEVFDNMPVAALIRKKILCMHGGFGPSLKSLDQIRNLQRPITEPAKFPVAQDLLWADPLEDMDGFEPNIIRGVSWFYGANEVKNLCEELKLTLIIRAHQMMSNGYGFFCGRKLLTIFSAPMYNEDGDNMAAIVTVGPEMQIGLKLFSPTKTDDGEREFRDNYFRGDTGYISRSKLFEMEAELSSMTIMPHC